MAKAKVKAKAKAKPRSKATKPKRAGADGVAKLLAEAVNTFNYPNEMGEPVWDSLVGLNEIAEALPASAERERRLIAKLVDELTTPTSAGEARLVERDGVAIIELRVLDNWVPVTEN